MSEITARIAAALADRYAIEGELGSGGMATVYLAEDLKHHRKVAVKVLRPDLAAALGPERFLREIEIAAQLTHPHILTLIDSGEAEGFLYYVMPFIEGESLRAKLAREGELPVTEAVKLLRDVVDALASAHKHGVVHRDIKPDNVLLMENHASVTDFGVAKAVGEATGGAQLTTAGVALGTPAYMAPEQAAANPQIDHRADIYAVGALAYELLTGRPPFEGDNPQMILAAHVTEAPKPITEYRETIPPALGDLVMRCLEKHPADRWQTAEEVLAKLEAMATPGGGVTPTGAAPVTAQRVGSRRVQVAVATGVAAMAVAAALVWLSRGQGERELDPNLVAVVPFRAGGVDPDLQYLREGIVDLLFARLTGEGGPRALAPQTAISAWQRAGGSEDADLPEERALELAADLGAAQLIQGGIVGSASRMTLNATLLDVPDGNVRARATVEGPADSLPGLIDRLTGQMLALRAGADARSLAELTSTSLPALKAYLDGQAEFRRGRYVEALRHFDRALQEDSTFALAGLWHSINATWGTGRSPVPGSDVAWAHRDRLGPRDRMLLDAWVGSSFPDLSSRAQYIDDGERAVALIPDRWEVWFLFGDEMYHFGPQLGISNPLERAMGAFERALELNPDFGPILGHVFEHAAITGDTSRVRETRDRYHAGVGAMSLRQEWLAAVLLGDSLALGAWRSGLDTLPWRQVFGVGILAQLAGVGLADAELTGKKALERARTRNENWLSLNRLTTLMLNTGRPRAAREFAQRAAEFEPDNGLHLHLWNQIQRALFWGADTGLAIDAARRLQTFADEPLSANAHVRRRQIGDHCALGIWHAATGNSGAARQSLTFLGEVPDDEPPVDRRAYRRTCVATLQAVLASPAERRGAVERLDSLLRTGPPMNWVALRPMNLTAATLWSAEGDVERALAAVRRRDYGLAINYASTFYREEGRLAALAGDTAGAIDAYQRYLSLRVDPEPAVQEEINQVRRELVKLVGESAR